MWAGACTCDDSPKLDICSHTCSQELALRNVLHVCSYCPTLRDDILELAVHQMLLIDVSSLILFRLLMSVSYNLLCVG